MPSGEVSFDTLRRKTHVSRPHVVILGAGASVAALPDGDARGLRLPVMNDLVQVLDLGAVLDEVDLEWRGQNFENVYLDLANSPALARLREVVEERMASYFRGLELPNRPTLYDYLVLSLRKKDVVATFNWDPFLFAAYVRERHCASMPQVLFLHGCAIIGYCPQHGKQGPSDARCGECRRQLRPTRLLYPIRDKDYTADPYIDSQWRGLRSAMRSAFVLTVFGYGAPESDVAAAKLMSDAWGDPERRPFEETELIDIKPEEELSTRWKKFIHTHHYRTTADYFASILGCFPRRSCEAIWEETQEIRYLEYTSVPRFDSLDDMRKWFRDVIAVEGDEPNPPMQPTGSAGG